MDRGAWRATDQGIAKCPTPPIEEHFTFLKRSPAFLSADSFRVHPGSYLCLLPHLQLTEPPYWTLTLPVRTCIGLDPSLTGCKTHSLMPPDCSLSRKPPRLPHHTKSGQQREAEAQGPVLCGLSGFSEDCTPALLSPGVLC